MHRLYILFSILTISLKGFCQEKYEIIPPENIKTILFNGPTDDQFPVITLSETLTLEFDDLYADEADYYYKIIHCNNDWTPSNLNKQQYLKGVDDVRITTYENSFTTLQPYSHYTLEIPNRNTKLAITGNYMIEIYDSYDEIVFSRKFMVYKNSLPVEVTLKRSRDLNYANTKQVVQFAISNTSQVLNPQQQLKVVLLQNYQWHNAKFDIAPQYTLGDEIIYKYDQETAFWAGNEYLNFENKNVRVSGTGVRKIDLKDLYHNYLYVNERRSDKIYTYNPDINGDFEITTDNGRNTETEAEYAYVHFALQYDPAIGFNDVYIYGKFNNYELLPENKLEKNSETGLLEATVLLKQGFYNYKYVVFSDKEQTIDYNAICGNFHQTENSYMVLVYYRGYGDLYDSLIGIGYGNSENLTN
ncbi:protein of unknown function [Pustulibacterium marinum]|uniref:Type 9 secretion system plug protein N-terminal domain-containing protein n=1 Tax=Pustulibacterium marinum TaxID=1224947 RepID=A0A1I7G6S4_9FLAO|nr:DUF5103 domain-containing protein [Pustulibacterium marinum]SFU44145.1 protein of unknown function [Pustulibacterium marinum]